MTTTSGPSTIRQHADPQRTSVWYPYRWPSVALVDAETWRRVRDIAEARTDIHNQRAMSDSDSYLTGLITCPHCGNKYIGTSARGCNRIYRYYTCYSRAR